MIGIATEMIVSFYPLELTISLTAVVEDILLPTLSLTRSRLAARVSSTPGEQRSNTANGHYLVRCWHQGLSSGGLPG